MILKKGIIHTIGLKGILISAFILFTVNGTATAGGLFGAPQPDSKEAGGLHSGIGYGYHEDRYRNDTDHTIRQNQVSSELGYGAKHWGIHGRIGVSDLKILDAFRSTQASTTTFKNDFKDDWKFFGALGGQGYYPFNRTFGIGAFLHGSYYFQDFTDDISGIQNGAGFTTEMKVKNLWDVSFAIGFQATVPNDIKLYAGPYLYYSQARISPPVNIPGLPFSEGGITIRNKTNIGGFSGVDVPLGRGFHLVVEGQYSERFSVGSAVTYSY
jgi:hypothetical protein